MTGKGTRPVLARSAVSVALIMSTLVAVAVVARFVAHPAGIWDQDEAYLAHGVLDFDPRHNQPHPPFFPLWIALGKAVVRLGGGLAPDSALQLGSALLAAAVVFPLFALGKLFLPRLEAAAGTVLCLLVPGPWLLGGRAYSEPAATTLLLTTATLWLPRRSSSWAAAAGGTAAAACLLIRPQWVLPVVLLTVWRVLRCQTWRHRLLVLSPLLGGGAVALGVVAQEAGGLAQLVAEVRLHATYMAKATRGFGWSFPELAINRACGGWAAGALWMALTTAGAVAVLRQRSTRTEGAPLVGLLIAPLALQLLLLQNPTLARYALPMLALTAPLVVVGARAVLKHRTLLIAAVGVWSGINIVLVGPALDEYRSRPAPVMAALKAVESGPAGRVLVVDRTLVSFIRLEQERGRLRCPVHWDAEAELGALRSPFHPRLMAVHTGTTPGWLDRPRVTQRFTTESRLLRSVAAPRFHDVTVVTGLAVRTPESPSITPDMLHPGAVIPPPGPR